MAEVEQEPIPKSALYIAVALIGGVFVVGLAPLPGVVSSLIRGEAGSSAFGPVAAFRDFWFDPQWWWASGAFAVALFIALFVARGIGSKVWALIGCVVVYGVVGYVADSLMYHEPSHVWTVLGYVSSVLGGGMNAWVAAAVAGVALFLFGAGSRFDPGNSARRVQAPAATEARSGG